MDRNTSTRGNYIFYICHTRENERKNSYFWHKMRDTSKTMKVGEQTKQLIKSAIKTTIDAYAPSADEAKQITDITIEVNQETGDLVTLDDSGEELARVNIEEWAGNTSDTFYDEIQPVLRRTIGEMKQQLLEAGIMKPYSILLADDEGDTLADLYTVEEGTVVLDDEMIREFDEDLDSFLDRLMNND